MSEVSYLLFETELAEKGSLNEKGEDSLAGKLRGYFLAYRIFNPSKITTEWEQDTDQAIENHEWSFLVGVLGRLVDEHELALAIARQQSRS